MTQELEKNPLWLILVETVHALPMYPSHKVYVRDNLAPKVEELSPEELSFNLDIPLGEAYVILHELKKHDAGTEEEKDSES
jgi:hypothetical protein